MDFGAKPNTDTIQTDAFQRAIDFCYSDGGGDIKINNLKANVTEEEIRVTADEEFKCAPI